jgi:ubiquinone/menaquinone biosynthesis C-methylase UbiE
MEQKIKETYWSRFTENYEEKQQHVVGKQLISLTKQEMLKEKNLGKVLELGCGTGLYTETLQKISQQIVATDFSEEMVEMARQKRGDLKNVRFEQADALNLKFKDESFDGIFMANLIHIIGNAEKVIQESRRMLKNGGSLIITSFAIDDMSFFNKMSMGIRYLKTFGKPSEDATKEKTSRKSVEALLIKNGFQIRKSVVLGNKSRAFYISGRRLSG